MPDSCFTAQQVNYFIEQAFIVQKQQYSFAYKDSIIYYQQAVMNEQSNQLNIHTEQNKDVSSDCASDKKKLKDNITALTKENKWRKIAGWITGPIALIGIGDMGFQYLTKK